MSTDNRSTTSIIAPRGTAALGVGVFGGISAFPIRVALDRGLFARHGLAVDLRVTPSSDALATGLLDGTYQVVHAAPDNFVAWSDRTGVAIDAWIGGSNGPVALVSRRDGGVAALRAGRIGVDAPTSGFAPILRRLLADGGVPVDAVELVELGATRHRAVALREGTIDATMLSLPWSALAVRDGAHLVADHTAVAPGLLTSSGGSSRSWLTSHPEVADRYLAGVVEALTIIGDPAQRTAVVSALAADLDVDESLADDILTRMLGRDGWPPTGAVDARGMEAACALRSEVVGPPLRSPSSYIDDGPVRRSMASRA